MMKLVDKSTFSYFHPSISSTNLSVLISKQISIDPNHFLNIFSVNDMKETQSKFSSLINSPSFVRLMFDTITEEPETLMAFNIMVIQHLASFNDSLKQQIKGNSAVYDIIAKVDKIGPNLLKELGIVNESLSDKISEKEQNEFTDSLNDIESSMKDEDECPICQHSDNEKESYCVLFDCMNGPFVDGAFRTRFASCNHKMHTKCALLSEGDSLMCPLDRNTFKYVIPLNLPQNKSLLSRSELILLKKLINDIGGMETIAQGICNEISTLEIRERTNQQFLIITSKTCSKHF